MLIFAYILVTKNLPFHPVIEVFTFAGDDFSRAFLLGDSHSQHVIAEVDGFLSRIGDFRDPVGRVFIPVNASDDRIQF